MGKFVIKETKTGTKFNLKANNGEVIATSEVYTTKVCRSALENAASVASVVLTTESLVADIPEPPAAAPANPDMGGMY